MGLEVPPCSSANKLKNTSSAVLPAPLNIASGVSICLPLMTKIIPGDLGGRNPETLHVIECPPSRLLLTGCSRLGCVSKSRAPVLVLVTICSCSGGHMPGARSALTQVLGHLHLSLVREGTGTNSCGRRLQKDSGILQ